MYKMRLLSVYQTPLAVLYVSFRNLNILYYSILTVTGFDISTSECPLCWLMSICLLDLENRLLTTEMFLGSCVQIMYQRSTHTHGCDRCDVCSRSAFTTWNTFNKSWPCSWYDKEMLGRIHDNIKRVASSKLSGTQKWNMSSSKNVLIRNQIAVTSEASQEVMNWVNM